jgi:hypothetical protein
MKKLLVLLLISTAMFSQTTTVKGIILSYDKVSQTMTLNIPKTSVKVYDKDKQISISISKEHTLNTYFIHRGYYYMDMSLFETSRPGNCTIIKDNLIFKFTDVDKGEYILEVSDLCNWKWVSNIENNSLIIE